MSNGEEAEDLKALVDHLVEQKLMELLGDPDEDLELNDAVKEKLTKSLGTTGDELSAEEVAGSLGINW